MKMRIREMQVLIGISKGMTSREIGKSIGLSEDTVKIYCKRLFSDLAARSRAHAVAQAYDLGLLPSTKGEEMFKATTIKENVEMEF